MSRPKIKNRHFVKVYKCIRLPLYLWKWMDSQDASRAVLIENAMRNYYKGIGGGVA